MHTAQKEHLVAQHVIIYQDADGVLHHKDVLLFLKLLVLLHILVKLAVNTVIVILVRMIPIARGVVLVIIMEDVRLQSLQIVLAQSFSILAQIIANYLQIAMIARLLLVVVGVIHKAFALILQRVLVMDSGYILVMLLPSIISVDLMEELLLVECF